ncbi:MAG: prepilin-type N-terminal cleavage/methylation domain-containing protein [Candidatus Omnitrophica bacterium]|nr:prepilin-type N-terminal cleavage/methylation domain-containing protein [Candidatus Omnitrophota bacterium]MBU4472643.1 prepilin-type N-terminal cleavage/methylation domain-containing protein [Candidatus Omnitrophota bacterium]MCG2706734.1 prepilin-type N-terminal cleavage/methylation domain-containing protein [Candidatus Omnitrophota bacterium]
MKDAFTLMEIVIVLVIIGILTTLAISQYTPGRETAMSKEAIVNLKLIAAAERIYRMETASYYPSSGSESNIAVINTNLKLYLTETNWDYSITGGADSFTAFADRNGSGGYLDCQYSIDADGEPNPNASCP